MMKPNGTKLVSTGGIDRLLLVLVVILTLFGVVMVYSAGSERSLYLYDNPHHMFVNQFVRAMVGFVMMAILSQVPYKVWKKIAAPAAIGAIVLLGMLFVGGVAESSKGATRWLHLGPVRFQPSELARYAIVLFIASWASKKGALMESFQDGLLVPLALAAVMAGMIVKQPDFSTAAMLMGTVLVMLFIARAKFVHLLMTVVSMGVMATLVVIASPHMRQRILHFIDPVQDRAGAGYQMMQSWIGLGRGGIFGVGLGESKQKLFFLPDAHTDFIYSIVGEEWGLIGTTLLLVLFLTLIYRGFRIAARCPDPFGSYLAVGISFSIGLYAMANMAIAVGVLPTTGLPLPLISYGGTSLIVTLSALGIVLNISKYQVENQRRTSQAGRGA